MSTYFYISPLCQILTVSSSTGTVGEVQDDILEQLDSIESSLNSLKDSMLDFSYSMEEVFIFEIDSAALNI